MKKLIVRPASQTDLSALEQFNALMYPGRKNAKSILSFYIAKDKNAISDVIVISDVDGAIYGQVIASRMYYYYQDSVVDSAWLFDLIVIPELQKTAQGAMLMMYCKKHYPTSCSTGANPNAREMHLKLGNKELGEIRKYVRIGSPLVCITSLFRKEIKANSFPKSIETKYGLFERITDAESIPTLDSSYNERLFEPCRDADYMKWRFFNMLHEYAVYNNPTTTDYFVVRTIVKFKVLCLVLVDYRCSMEDSTRINGILEAMGTIARKKRIGILITGSSLYQFDKELERRHFRSIGRPRPVLGFVDVGEAQEAIAKRDFCFITLADSDGETNL